MYLLLCLIQVFLLSTACLASNEIPLLEELPVQCERLLSEVLDGYFTDIPRNEISITRLTGGHSNTCLKIEARSQTYVLRIKDKETSQISLKRELYAMHEGMNLGIAPQILYVSNDLNAVLMDYIGPHTLTLAQAKEPVNCVEIANTIRKVHGIPKNPYVDESINDSALSVYYEIVNTPSIKTQLDTAVELMEAYTKKLDGMEACKVNTHGELNSRNIFMTDTGAIFIDWEYTGWEDPFFDLSYLALRLDYSQNEEMLLLESYLQHPPASEDLERYSLTKKIHLSQLCIYFHYFSLKFNQDQLVLDDSTPLRDLSYYMKIFSDQDDNEENLAQFYYDLARLCLELAKE